jgi:excisionase family DNA binding protein
MSVQGAEKSDLGPLVVKPRQAELLLSCSHKRLYELLAAGELQSFRDGSSRKITVESIKQYIARGLATSVGSNPKGRKAAGENS